MQRFDSLDEIIQFIQNKHKSLSRMKGVYGYKMLKRHEGSRIPFEEVKGLTLKQMDVVGDRSVVIDLCCLGYEFKKQMIMSFNSRLFLNNLAVINVYDHKTEFFSFDCVDFVYLETNEDARLQLFKEWILGEPGVMRAQWAAKIPEIEKILDEVGLNRKIKVAEEAARPLDMSSNWF
jgi:hypothetical protein